MKVKSLEELQKIREEHKEKIALRKHGETAGDKVEILVGMATCGISSGAREILNGFIEEIAKEKLDYIRVIPVGCIGYCHSEPTIQVNIPGQKPVIYGNVKSDHIADIIKQHIKDGNPVEKLVLHTNFERV